MINYNFRMLITFLCLLFLPLAFNKIMAQTSYEYYFPTAWEHQYGKSGGQPVIGNVVKIESDCPGAKTGIFNDFREYYIAYFSKNRGFNNLDRDIVWGPYETYEEASKERTKFIADKNYQWVPLLIFDFSTTCD